MPELLCPAHSPAIEKIVYHHQPGCTHDALREGDQHALPVREIAPVLTSTTQHARSLERLGSELAYFAAPALSSRVQPPARLAVRAVDSCA